MEQDKGPNRLKSLTPFAELPALHPPRLEATQGHLMSRLMQASHAAKEAVLKLLKGKNS
jgi:hypothetical protein